jgi:hypothetical protein
MEQFSCWCGPVNVRGQVEGRGLVLSMRFLSKWGEFGLRAAYWVGVGDLVDRRTLWINGEAGG